MNPEFRIVEDVDADWPVLWPMLDASLQYHAGLAGGNLKQGIEDILHRDLANGTSTGRLGVIVAEDDGAAVAMATLRILPRGITTPTPAALLTDAYVRPDLRRQGMMSALEARRRDWVREHGCTVVERTILSANSLAMAAWGHNVWGFTLRRPVAADSTIASTDVRRVRDLDADWRLIWPLLQGKTTEDEATAKARIERIAANHGHIYITEDEPASGVIAARISGSPWIIEERVCMVRECAVADGAPRDTTDRLLAALEPWAARKGASVIQTRPIREDLAAPWFRRGFASYSLQLSEPV